MKKLAMALAITTITAGSAVANISTGFFLGGGVGYGSSTSEARFRPQAANPSLRADPYRFSADIGEESGALGLLAGYNMVSGCWVFGGEVYYTFLDQKMTGRYIETNEPEEFRYKLKRNGVYGLKARVGWLLTPSAMMFVGAAAEGGRWKARVHLQNQVTGAFIGNRSSHHHDHRVGCHNDINFVPSIGMEIAANKNVYLRGEYSYEFGSDRRVKVRDDTANLTGVRSIRFEDLNSQRFMVSVIYKFGG